MMTLNELKIAVSDGNDFYFMYDGLRVGVECTVNDSRESFELWYGDVSKEYDNIDDVVNDKLFKGKSISDLLSDGAIEIDFA